MNLRILVDNNTLVDRYFLSEPGFSALVETENCRVLFDLGYSDIFMQNARKSGINLFNLDYVALSHGHLDHTWGLVPLIMALTEAQLEKIPHARPRLVAHPDVFLTKKAGKVRESGCLFTAEKCGEHFDLHLSKSPTWLSTDLVFLGEIPRRYPHEAPATGREIKRDGKYEPDLLLDDTALVWRGSEGLVVITGCSHSGICNIVAYAREVCGEERVSDIVGGLHLLNTPRDRLESTVSALMEMGIKRMHPCHCTDLVAKNFLAGFFVVGEVGSGMELQY